MCGLRMPRSRAAAASTSVRGSPAPRSCAKNCASCARKARSLPGVRPSRQGRRPHPFLAVGRVECRERRPVEHHRLIELLDHLPKRAQREPLPRLAEHPRLDLRQRRLAVEVADDRLEAVERDQHRIVEDARAGLPARHRSAPDARGAGRREDEAWGVRGTPYPRSLARTLGQRQHASHPATSQGARSATYLLFGKSREPSSRQAQRQERGGSAIKGRDQAGGAASWGGFGCMLESPCGGASDQDSNGCSKGIRENC